MMQPTSSRELDKGQVPRPSTFFVSLVSLSHVARNDPPLQSFASAGVLRQAPIVLSQHLARPGERGRHALNGRIGAERQRIEETLTGMDKRNLSECDIGTKFITPALRWARWDEMLQIREEVSFTKGRIIVRGKLVTRGKAKRAYYILCYKPYIPVVVIEAEENSHTVGDGMQKALDYAEPLNNPFCVLLQRRRFRVPRPHRCWHVA